MKLFISLAFIIGYSYAIAQCPLATNYQYLQANQVRAAIPSAIELFRTKNTSGEFFVGIAPADKKTTIDYSGIWLAGLRPDGSYINSFQYSTSDDSGSDFSAGPILKDHPVPEFCNQWDKVWSVYKYEIEAHRKDFADNGIIDHPIPSIFSWPGKENPHFLNYNQFQLPAGSFAPFQDNNGDSIYDPMQGDFPLLDGVEKQPDQITWSVFNDKYPAYRTWNPPMNIEGHRTTWAYYCQDNPVLNNTIFVRYLLINKGHEIYDSLIFGIKTEFDIGCFSDDYAGTSIRHNAVFGYNRWPEDPTCFNSNGFGMHPPVQAMAYLNKHLFSSYISGTGVHGGVLKEQIYNELNGYHYDGVPQTAAGQGYKTNGLNTLFSFPGNPWVKGEWSMYQENIRGMDIKPLASIYLGTFEPGATQSIDLAYLFVSEPGFDHLENVSAMYEQLDSLQHWYQEGFKNHCQQEIGYCSTDCVWPGDANNDGTANHEDLLAIGLNNGATGNTRSGAVNWAPKSSEPWSGPSQKYADADGNGIIDRSDKRVTQWHYNFVRPDYNASPDVYPIGPELSIRPNLTGAFNNITPGQSIMAHIQLTQVPALQGLAFSLVFDSNYFDRIDTAGTNGNTFQLVFSDSTRHQLDFARFDLDLNNNIPAQDNLYTFSIKAPTKFPNGRTNDTTWLRFKNIIGIKKDGTTIPLGGTDLKAVFAKSTVAYDPKYDIQNLSVYPNPVADRLSLDFPGLQVDKITWLSVDGVTFKTMNGCQDHVEIDTSTFPSGLYFLKIEKQGFTTLKKILIE